MLKKTHLCAALVAALMHAPFATAQTVPWRVVAGTDGRVATADLPAGINRTLTDYWLGDAGAGLVGFRVSSPSTSAGYWARTPGGLKRYVQTGVGGSLGPGRSGAESNHVFLDYMARWGGAAPDGQRIFLAQAGDPALPGSAASYGVWRWDGTHNIEIARSLSDGVLGPGLGAGWVFPNSSGFSSGRMLRSGQALYVGTVTTPTSASRDVVAKHIPGQGNVPCALEDSTDPALSPGVVAGDTFPADWNGSLNRFSVTDSGRVYGTLSTSNSRVGIWELCNSAPRAITVDLETGARGPAIGIATAYFSDFYGAPAVPGSEGTFFFFARGREASGGASFSGLFQHDGLSNRPLALAGDTGAYSPHWGNATFAGISIASLSAAGDYAAFEASLDTPDGSATGLFRVRAGNPPEPVAILGVVGDYGPEPNRTWANLTASAVLGNGDIVLEATTNPGSEHALWLLQHGRLPRRLLREGDIASVPTAAGTVQAAVNGFYLPESGGGAQYSSGVDSWIGADGTILVWATLNTYDRALIVAQPSNPADLIFRNGFDG
ncbi:MAG TPA: hypothetical protein VGC55_06225 [Dokdonella sp.]